VQSYRYIKKHLLFSRALDIANKKFGCSLTSTDIHLLIILSSCDRRLLDIANESARIKRTLDKSNLSTHVFPRLLDAGLIYIDTSSSSFLYSISPSGIILLNELESLLSSLRYDR
jgi:hypothetical protein